jgi:hypothetical protein
MAGHDGPGMLVTAGCRERNKKFRKPHDRLAIMIKELQDTQATLEKIKMILRRRLTN